MFNYQLPAHMVYRPKKFIGSGEDVPPTKEELNNLIRQSVHEAAEQTGSETVKAFFHDYTYN